MAPSSQQLTPRAPAARTSGATPERRSASASYYFRGTRGERRTHNKAVTTKSDKKQKVLNERLLALALTNTCACTCITTGTLY